MGAGDVGRLEERCPGEGRSRAEREGEGQGRGGVGAPYDEVVDSGRRCGPENELGGGLYWLLPGRCWERPPNVTFALSRSSSLPETEEDGRRRRMDFVDFWRSREGRKGDCVISGDGEGARLRQNLRLLPGLGELVDISGDRISGGGVSSSLTSVRSVLA